MPGNIAALAKRSDARAQRRAQSRARREAAACACEQSASGGSRRGSRFSTVAANARRKLSHDDHILAVDGAGKPYPKSALLCLALNNPLRQSAIRVIRWPVFDNLILLAILANCIFMALDPVDWLDQVEVYFLTLFTLEMSLKVVALGFAFHKGSYLRDLWNWLDFTVVMTGWVSIIMLTLPGSADLGFLSTLRAVRVLRPLRTINRVPGMKVLVRSLLDAIPPMANVAMLCFFIFLVFGIIGVQLFSGMMHHRCHDGAHASLPLAAAPLCVGDGCVTELLVNLGVATRLHGLDLHWLGDGARAAVSIVNVSFSVDNSSWSHHHLLQAGGGDACEAPVGASAGLPLSLQLAGSGVLAQWAKLQLDLSCSGAGLLPTALKLNVSAADPVADTGLCCDPTQTACSGASCDAGQYCVWGASNPNGVNSFDNILWAFITIFQCISLEGWVDNMYMLQDGMAPWVVAYFIPLILLGAFFVINLFLAVIFDSFYAAQAEQQIEKEKQIALDKETGIKERWSKARSGTGLKQRLSGNAKKAGSSLINRCHCLKWRVECIHKLVTHAWFDRLMLGGIMLNTVVLASYYHDMPVAHELVNEYINLALSALFTVEMVLKLLGFSTYHYFQDRWNAFDGFIVITSLIEILMSYGGVDADIDVSVLRTFRLLRVLKLARSLAGLRQIIETVLSSLTQIMNLFAILFLVMFIFALLGMEMFRGTYTEDKGFGPTQPSLAGVLAPPGQMVPEPYVHFDNFYFSIVTIFVVISGENWNDVYFTAYQAIGWPATIYFLLLVIIGNYTMLNLFIAILLGNFEAGVSEPEGSDRISAVRNLVLKHRDSVSWPFTKLLRNPRPRQPSACSAGGAASCTPIKQRSLSVDEKLQTAATVNYANAKERDAIADEVITTWTELAAQPPIHRTKGRSFTEAELRTVFASIDTSGDGEIGFAELKAAIRNVNPNVDDQTVERMLTFADADGDAQVSFVEFKKIILSATAVEVITTWMELAAQPPIHRAGRRPFTDEELRAVFETIDTSGDGEIEAAELQVAIQRVNPNVEVGTVVRMLTFADSDGDGEINFDEFKKIIVAGVHNHLAAVTAHLGAAPLAAAPAAANGVAAVEEDGTQPSAALRANLKRGFKNAVEAITDGLEQTKEADKVVASGARTLADDDYVPLLDRDKALFLFTREHPFRASMIVVVNSKLFDQVVLVLIIVSSLCLAVPLLEYPSVEKRCAADPGGSACTLQHVLGSFDYFFTIVFTLELLSKVIANGLITPYPTAYLRDAWNQLDAVIVIISWVSFDTSAFTGDTDTEQNGAFAALKTLRTFRALRPLRMISRNPGMKLVVNSLLRAMPGVANVMSVQLLFMLIFGILGQQLFSGKMAVCTDATVALRAECVGDFVDADSGDTLKRVWVNPEFGHFDNIFRAILTLFEMSGLEMWPDVMYHGMDAYAIDEAPRRDASAVAALFFIMWIFVGALFINNLVVGVVIDNFNQIKDQESGSAFLTAEQKDWVDTIKRSTEKRPQKTHRPQFGGLRLKLWEITRSNQFEIFILLAIIFNVLMMATFNCVPDEAAQACIIEPLWAEVWRYSNYLFSLIFVFEMFIKQAALGMRYFNEAWNCFDVILVCSSIVDLTLEVVGSSSGMGGFNPTILRVLRIFRVARLLRLVRRAKGIRLLLATLVSSLPSLCNVGSLLLLLLFVFAVLGVSLFSELTIEGRFITKNANFRTFSQAYLLLFRCVTGESWNGIMHDAMITEELNPNRCSNDAGTCGSPLPALVYFIFFTLIGSFVMLNLVIAVILENFSGLSSEDEQVVPDSLLEEFVEQWARLDPDGDGLIPSQKLTTLLRRVVEPVGFASKRHGGVVMTRQQQMIFLTELEIPDHGGQISFQEVLQACTRHAHSDAIVALPASLDLTLKIGLQVARAMKAAKVDALPEAEFSQAQAHAANLMQAAVRGRATRQSFPSSPLGMRPPPQQERKNRRKSSRELFSRRGSKSDLFSSGAATVVEVPTAAATAAAREAATVSGYTASAAAVLRWEQQCAQLAAAENPSMDALRALVADGAKLGTLLQPAQREALAALAERAVLETPRTCWDEGGGSYRGIEGPAVVRGTFPLIPLVPPVVPPVPPVPPAPVAPAAPVAPTTQAAPAASAAPAAPAAPLRAVAPEPGPLSWRASTAGERAGAWARAREAFGGQAAAYQVTSYVGAAAAATSAGLTGPSAQKYSSNVSPPGKKAADAADAILTLFDGAALPRAAKLSLPASALYTHSNGCGFFLALDSKQAACAAAYRNSASSGSISGSERTPTPRPSGSGGSLGPVTSVADLGESFPYVWVPVSLEAGKNGAGNKAVVKVLCDGEACGGRKLTPRHVVSDAQGAVQLLRKAVNTARLRGFKQNAGTPPARGGSPRLPGTPIDFDPAQRV